MWTAQDAEAEREPAKPPEETPARHRLPPGAASSSSVLVWLLMSIPS